MTAAFPGGVYSPRTKANKAGVVYDADKTTVGYAEDITKLDDEVVAIETELGASPKGGFSSVRARLDDIDSAWSSFDPISSGITIGSGVALGYYKQIGKTVHFNIAITLAADSSVTGTIIFSLPVAVKTRTGSIWPFIVRAREVGVADHIALSNAVSAGTTHQVKIPGTNTSWDATNPFTFGDTDTLSVSGTYECD